MTNIMGTFHNVTTGEIEYRELTDEEQANIEKVNADIAAAEAEARAKAEAKANAEAKLAALGLTADEIAALSK